MTATPGLETSTLQRSEQALREIAKLLEECFTAGAVSAANLAGRHVEARLEITFQLSRGQREASASGVMGILGSPGIPNDGLLRQTVTRWDTDENEGPVFIHRVEVMETRAQSVPALCLAESCRDEQIGGSEDTARYFALLSGTFELFPRFVDWEAALATFCNAVGNGTHCGADDRPQPAKPLHADNEDDCANTLSELELGERFRSLRERLLSKTVRARFIHYGRSEPVA